MIPGEGPRLFRAHTAEAHGCRGLRALAARGRSAGIPRLPLDGRPVDAVWDPGLAPARTALGIALHEEVTLDLLVGDLSGRA
ncbi:DUF2399 domain-containing protein [Streptomyces spongiicola]|uniref:DUF2399 domain-containing protein n=1 Tax=Streptomyces spongiicola TaxID=1690221 RepID=UPI0033DEA724